MTLTNNKLQNWDYSNNGYYFVTICTKNKDKYFGEIKNEEMILNDIGKIAEKYWQEIPKHFDFVVLDEFIVMPNHIHGIIIIDKNNFVETQDVASLQLKHKQNKFGPQSRNLASIIRGFKIGVTKYSNQNNINFQWQPRFYDRIIRTEQELSNIREYIAFNPEKWPEDENFVNSEERV